MPNVNRSPSADSPAVATTATSQNALAPSAGGIKVLVAVVVVALLALAGWQMVTRLGSSSATGSVATFEITRRSFPIIEEVKGELKAKNTKEIKSKVEGRATIIWLIEEGATVKEGDLLVKLASDKIEERITQEEATEASAIASLEAAEKDLEILIDENKSNVRKAELALELAEIELQKYLKGDAKKKEMDIDLDIERSLQMHERSKLDFEAAKSLHEKRFITKSELLQDEFSLHEAERAVDKAKLAKLTFETYEYPKEVRKRQSDVDEARKELDRVKKSALAKEAQKNADVEAKRAKLLNTQTQLNKYREQLEYCEIKAPAPGLVVYHSGHRWDPQKIAEGSEVHERQTIVNLPDPSVMLVSVRIHEAKTHKIELGQTVNVEVEAIPGEVFTGKITKIAPLADSRNQWLNPDLKEYETEITLDQSAPALKPGVTARAEIEVSNLDNVLCTPLQTVYSKAGHHFVFVADGKDGTPREVQIGESSSEFVEITDGLKGGEEVLLAASDAAKTKLPDLDPKEPIMGNKGDQAGKAVASNNKSKKGKVRRGGGGGKPRRGSAGGS